MSNKNYIVLICFLSWTASSISYGQVKNLEYIENKGQWHENVEFKADLVDGSVFLESNGFSFVFN
ncbi:MAG: hypothetical protein HRT57_16450, partial [Crocinitomicaceae bacterium]|nr:hypothetical protein [Crocinitomicaceae bacterium]